MIAEIDGVLLHLAHPDRADMLVAFYQHSYDAHIGSLRPGGVLVYDSDLVKPAEGDNRFTNVAVPITSATVEAVGGTGKDKGKNIFILGLIARIFDLDVAKLSALIKERFGGRNEDIVRNAMLAFDAGYAWPQNNLRDLFYRFEAADQPVDLAIEKHTGAGRHRCIKSSADGAVSEKRPDRQLQRTGHRRRHRGKARHELGDDERGYAPAHKALLGLPHTRVGRYRHATQQAQHAHAVNVPDAVPNEIPGK